jgi:hypothetical protein
MSGADVGYVGERSDPYDDAVNSVRGVGQGEPTPETDPSLPRGWRERVAELEEGWAA